MNTTPGGLTSRDSIRREWRVIASANRSPLPLRIVKWAVFLGISRRLYGTRWFLAWVLGLPLLGVATHLLYRHATNAWTRPWGGWNDVAAVDTSGGLPHSPVSGGSVRVEGP